MWWCRLRPAQGAVLLRPAYGGLEVVESKSSRPRTFTNLLSVKLSAADGERWAEGAVFEGSGPRLVLVDGIAIDAPLDGTMIVICNTDQPGT